MSSPSSRSNNTLVINGVTYREVHASTRICTTLDYARASPGALIDGGCNGGMAGDDCHCLGDHF